MTPDSYDRRLIAALQRDATLSNAQLAEVVNLSPSQCSRRRAALEAAGILKGYHARVDAAKLGFTLRALVRVSLRAHTRDDHQTLARWMEAQPEVKSAFSVSGSADYVLDVRTRDLDHFSDFVHERLLLQRQVGQIQSDFVLKTLKDGDSLILSDL